MMSFASRAVAAAAALVLSPGAPRAALGHTLPEVAPVISEATVDARAPSGAPERSQGVHAAQTPEEARRLAAEAAERAREEARRAQAEAHRVQEEALRVQEEARSVRELQGVVEQERRSRAERYRGRWSSEKEAVETKTFTVARDAALSLVNIAGAIVVEASPGDTIRVEARRVGRGATEADAQEQLDQTRVSYTQHGNRVEVRAYHTGRMQRSEVFFTVAVPASVAVDVRSISGDVRLKGLKGEARADTVSGDLAAEALSALASVKTVSGDLRISGCSSSREVTAGTVSGEIVVRGLKARSCNIGTVSGTVDLADAACDETLVRSVSGDVIYAGSLVKSGRYELKSHSGDIHLRLDGKVGFDVDAQTFSGTVRSDWPIAARASEDEGAPGWRRSRHTSLRGTFGDGSAELSLTTFSGDIFLGKR